MTELDLLTREVYAEKPAINPFSRTPMAYETARDAGITSWVRAYREAQRRIAAEELAGDELLWGKDSCGCQRNSAGDIRCHKCFEYVNERCWNCGTPRGEGECPTGSKPHRSRSTEEA